MTTKTMTGLNPTQLENQAIERFLIRAFEGDIYTAGVVIDGEERPLLTTEDQRPKQFRTLADAKQFLKGINACPIETICAQPYDEMIGNQSAPEHGQIQTQADSGGPTAATK